MQPVTLKTYASERHGRLRALESPCERRVGGVGAAPVPVGQTRQFGAGSFWKLLTDSYPGKQSPNIAIQNKYSYL